MIPSQESAVRSILAGDGATKIRVEGTTIKEVVTALFAEEMAKLKKVRLTWNPSQVADPPDPSLRIGQLCKWKPYMGPFGVGRYFVQNMKVLYSNGEPVEDMTTISTEKRRERITDGKGNFLREQEYKSDRELVDDGLRFYMQMALRLDPNICKYCVQFSTEDRMEYLRHLKKKHPHEFERELKSEEDAEPIEPEPVTATSRKSRAATQ